MTEGLEKARDRIDGYLSREENENWKNPETDTLTSPPPTARADERLWKAAEFMRHAGYYEGAVDLANALVNSIEEGSSPEPPPRTAGRLWFEKALAYRDLGNYNKENLAIAQRSAERALICWQLDADEQRIAAARSVLGFLDFIRGNFDASRKVQESVLATRNALLARAPESPDLLADVGRSLDLLGRTEQACGRTSSALTYYRKAVNLWDQCAERELRRHARPNHAVSLSRQAVVEARLGLFKDANTHSSDALLEVEEVSGREHRNTALVQCQHAEVLRLAGQFHTALECHRMGIENAARHWGRTHPVFAVLQLSYAMTARAAGRLDDAFIAAVRTLGFWRDFEVRVQEAGSAAKTAQAHCWLELGQTLLESAVTVPADVEAYGPVVQAARKALEQAQNLFRTVLPDPDVSHSATLQCWVALAEVVVLQTLSDEVPVERAAEAMRSYVSEHKGITQALLALDSRLIAARADRLMKAKRLNGKNSTKLEEELDRLQTELKELQVALDSGELEFTPLDALEAALATAEVTMAEFELRVASSVLSNTSVDLSYARKEVADQLTKFQAILDGKPHQLVARSYAALAELADMELSVRTKARNERECERNRPAFDVDAHLTTMGRLLEDRHGQ
jgi:tetratricopeptide (TPR) repeat protein